MNNNPTLRIHTHWQVTQSLRSNQNPPKSMAAPTNGKRTHRHTTKAIRNAGKILNIKMIATNKISGKLKINRFKTPHSA